MKRAIGTIAAVLMLGTIGVGTVSADPINANSRYLSVSCNGEVLNLVTQSGSVAQVLGDSRVLVLQGVTEDGVWIVPISKGQQKADLVACTYLQLFNGHQFVIWVNITNPAN